MATWMSKASTLHHNPDPAHANEDLPETNEMYEKCWKALAYHVFPTRALQHQHRYLRRHLCKPQMMEYRVFTARVLEINGFMAQFPNGQLDDEGIPTGFAVEQSLLADELLDIFEFALPNSWQKLLIKHGVDVLKGTPEQGLRELASFCERKELTESMEKHLGPSGKSSETAHNTELKSASKSSGAGAQNNHNHNHNTRNNKRKSGDSSEKYCPLHNTYGHDSNECKVLQDHVKKLREGYSNLSQSTQRWKEKQEKRKKENQLRAAIEAVLQEKIRNKRKAEKEVRFAEEKEDEDEDDMLFRFHDATTSPAKQASESDTEEFANLNLDELSLSEH